MPIRVDNSQQSVYQILVCRFAFLLLNIPPIIAISCFPSEQWWSEAVLLYIQGHCHTLLYLWRWRYIWLSAIAGYNRRESSYMELTNDYVVAGLWPCIKLRSCMDDVRASWHPVPCGQVCQLDWMNTTVKAPREGLENPNNSFWPLGGYYSSTSSLPRLLADRLFVLDVLKEEVSVFEVSDFRPMHENHNYFSGWSRAASGFPSVEAGRDWPNNDSSHRRTLRQRAHAGPSWKVSPPC